MNRLLLAALGAALTCTAAAAQDLNAKAPVQSEMILIENATVFTVAAGVIENGYVYFKDGVIQGVGKVPAPAISEKVRIVDGTGKRVYPGLITPYSQIGLIEIAAVRATLDTGEVGVGTPEARAAASVNPDSTNLPVACSGGVLLAAVFPRSKNDGMLAYFGGPVGLVPGRVSVMRLEGWTWESMTVLDDAGLVVDWPFPRVIDAPWMNRTRLEQSQDYQNAMRSLDDLFSAASAYARAGNAVHRADVRLEAMRSVLPIESSQGNAGGARAQRPVFIEANDLDAIEQGVAFCQRHELRCVIVGGRDAPLCTDLLLRHDVGVIVEGIWRFPKRDDSPVDDGFTVPARLEQAGVNWCLSSGESVANERNLALVAGTAVGYGLSPQASIESITLRPAKMLGVDARYGSVEVGKSATLIITDGDVLEVTTNTLRAYIDGRELDLNDKQKTLASKYREKYRQIGKELGKETPAGTNGPATPPPPTPPIMQPVPTPVTPADREPQDPNPAEPKAEVPKAEPTSELPK